ncbi:uncharacterized protein EV422DRAFT_160717 [Fimicolochytrium jonesii]|uniref:uncharacterized protein n=1 Tax=Fimicolochytrium jonesii TaxID=1396493 RepID=UPI0022FF2677|nr:uncharacterized protein EV422DRAFT_160717 [Fimicolochytrium jonesii]KAI8826281.1 hypothetical protein EV422DRAFT_160717 [Fimicolochytrium jonesii]
MAHPFMFLVPKTTLAVHQVAVRFIMLHLILCQVFSCGVARSSNVSSMGVGRSGNGDDICAYPFLISNAFGCSLGSARIYGEAHGR